jgi:hypothetical protein
MSDVCRFDCEAADEDCVEAIRQAYLLTTLVQSAAAAQEGPTTTEQKNGKPIPDLDGQP